VLVHVFAAVRVGSEISSHPPGDAGGFRFHPRFTRRRGWANLQTSSELNYEEGNMSTAMANEITIGIPRINDTAPNFTAETTQGTINFHEWIGDGWAILFSHPKDFTPVCTTELGYMAGLQPEFAKRNTKIIGLSVDPVSSHGKWAADIEETQGHKVNYPMIGDPELRIAKLYGMLPAGSGNTSEGRTAADNATVRTVFVVGPDKKIKLQLSYPMSTGRNFDEILRVIDSMQLTAKHKVATPVNWKPGDEVIILPAVSNEEAQQKYPGGWKSPKPYLRIVPQPK
jgi:alkyl hydroperoxide reductase subunit AhpC